MQGGKVFVAYDDDHANKGERVAVSNDNGAMRTIDNPINNSPQPNSANPNSPNPGTRIAVDARGVVYTLFGAGPSISPGVYNVTYYLNRSSDGGATWDLNPNSAVGGIITRTASSATTAF